MKRFRIQIVSDCVLTEREIWPDDNVPKNPTVKDVREAMVPWAGGKGGIISEWLLPVSYKVTEVKAHPIGQKAKRVGRKTKA